ncbi:MAG: glycosyltransferase family 2 protein [Eubacterium sp.]
MDLSIIIVNYKTKELTSNCIDSIYESNLKGIDYEILVVDNASNDGSIESIEVRFPKVKSIKNNENLGFSKANNIGMEQSSGDYILLLNSDTIVEIMTIRKSLEFMRNHQHVGALGCKIVLESGELDAACKRSFPTPMNGIYHTLKLDRRFPKSHRFGEYNLTYINPDKTFSVDCIMGAYMMVTREMVKIVGLLDEDYFMYGEDVDWCYRIKKAGFQIIYYPEVRIFHYKKASGIGKRNPKVIEAFYDSMLIFYKKHYKHQYNPFTTWCVFSGTKMMKKRALRKNK